MRKLHKGDEVIVLAGKDKGKRGAINKVLANGSLIVENVNVARKHKKPNPNAGVPGGIVDQEMPIDASNVAIFNSATGKADRVGFQVQDDGRKVRIFKSNNEVIGS